MEQRWQVRRPVELPSSRLRGATMRWHSRLRRRRSHSNHSRTRHALRPKMLTMQTCQCSLRNSLVFLQGNLLMAKGTCSKTQIKHLTSSSICSRNKVVRHRDPIQHSPCNKTSNHSHRVDNLKDPFRNSNKVVRHRDPIQHNPCNKTSNRRYHRIHRLKAPIRSKCSKISSPSKVPRPGHFHSPSKGSINKETTSNNFRSNQRISSSFHRTSRAWANNSRMATTTCSKAQYR
mmetsp:Transcript_34154/g.56018  ORF Transcript_34154/g.56018 Transcript_34154/m.56018 type:complete len:232 (+) Transcript_34154:525-1220(+)